MKLAYKYKIFCSFVFLFALFAVAMIIFEQREEKVQKTEALELQLNNYTEVIHSYVKTREITNDKMGELEDLITLLPDEMRVTVINDMGKVLFDKDVSNIGSLDNHLERPEIKKALFQANGTHIRMSASTKQEYLYFAKYYESYYIRVALPYNIQVKSVLKADNLFIYIVLGMFLVILILLNYVSGRFGKSITQLKRFTTAISEDQVMPAKVDFPDDELGEIGDQLAQILAQKEASKFAIEQEKEKLIQHFQFSEEGLCIFTSDFKKIYANTHFIQYVNLITDRPTFDINSIAENESFYDVFEFLKNENKVRNNFSTQINKGGKIFHVQAVVFEDKSFEITIKDISKTEKTRLLKQEMTNNIAHELRTPVTSLRGYLETLNTQNLPEEKRAQFIDRAFHQSVRLSNLIEDVSLLSKIEEVGTAFKLEDVNLSQLINDVRIDLIDRLQQNNVKLNVKLASSVVMKGNYTLLYSVFRNLINNSINYGGEGVEIYIENYMQENGYLYFSYYDTGKGVESQHLSRLFERFYRTDDGRTRNTGGSGLGLSIVKNAILFHKGDIQARMQPGAGLGFLFTLRS